MGVYEEMRSVLSKLVGKVRKGFEEEVLLRKGFERSVSVLQIGIQLEQRQVV